MTESPVLKVELRITDDDCETPGRIRRRVSATVWLEGSDSKRYLNGCLIAAPTGTLETDYIETDEIGMGDDAKAGEALLTASTPATTSRPRPNTPISCRRT